MGNHRSYSKGCRTCVKRRVKCDQRRPTCLRCEKLGFSCEGFNETVFVDARQQVLKRFASVSNSSSSSSTSAISSTRASSYKSDDELITIAFADHCWQVPHPTQIWDYIPRSPSTSPIRDDIHVCYTIKNLHLGQLAMMYCDVLPYDLPGLDIHQSMMNQCLFATAKLFYGLRNHDHRVLEDGMRLYGRGLSMLNDVLSKVDCTVTTEIVVSVLSLCMSESIMPSSKSSWMIHVLGLERLFALQGPMLSENSSKLDLIVREACRPLMIMGAFFTQKPSLMSKHGWEDNSQLQISNRSLNLLRNSTVESDLSFLMGILAQIPAIFLQCNRCIQLAKTKTIPQTRLNMIGSRLKQLQQELQGWKEKWNDNHQNEIYETPITMVNLDQPAVWKTVFNFSSIELAKTYNLYHAVVILLGSIPPSLLKFGLEPPFSAPGPSYCENLSIAQSLSDIKTSVQSICRSIEYYLQCPQPSQNLADYYLFFPIHVARRASNQWGYSSELLWLADAFKIMRTKYSTGLWANMDFGSHFSGFQDGLFG